MKNEVLVWEKADGSLSFTTLYADVDMNEEIAKIQAVTPDLVGITPTVKTLADLPKTKQDREQARLSNGDVVVDKSVKTSSEKEAETTQRKQAILSKLGLTENELADILKG